MAKINFILKLSAVVFDIFDLFSMEREFDTVICSRTLGHYNFIYPPEEKKYSCVIHSLWEKTKKRLIITLPEITRNMHKIIRGMVSELGNVEELVTDYRNKGFNEDFVVFIVDREKDEKT